MKSELRHDLQFLTHEELEDKYGITIEPSGSVFDNTESIRYKTLAHWADAVEQEDESYMVKTTHKKHYDDYY